MTDPKPPLRKVALLIETSNAYARGLLHGVVAWQREHRPWSRFLAETDLPLETIAERTGFTHPEYLSVVFRRELGLPPSRYRAQGR